MRAVRQFTIFVLLVLGVTATAYVTNEPGNQTLLAMGGGVCLMLTVMLLDSDWGQR